MPKTVLFGLACLACLVAVSYGQNSSATKSACMCLCCNTNAECGIPGAFQVDTCGQCTGESIAANCPAYFPDLCTAFESEEQCSVAEIDSDWTGDWVIDPCSACLLDEKNQPVGDCLPCCDSTQCDCIYGTVTIENGGVLGTNGTSIQQLQLSVSGTSSLTSIDLANQTGNAGITATVNISEKYDLIKDGDHIRFMNRRTAACNVAATRNPPSTSILKLALLIGGVGVVALACIVYCCCNPCAKKKKDTALLGEGQEGQEGQTKGVPPPYAPVSDASINYTGKPNPNEL
jgi:hypothetical protein